MWPYWVMFALPAVMALQERTKGPYHTRELYRRGNIRIPAGWWVLMITLTLLIGLRHEVGGDWFNYLRNFEDAYFKIDDPAWWWNDPGYRLLEWLAIRMNWSIYVVNLLSAAIFTYGLVLFCRHLPRPWLALAVSVPYLVIVLGMGYTRQGVALGCIMAGLVALSSGKNIHFIFWTLFAATFHKTAVIVMPLAALAASRKRIYATVWVSAVVFVAFSALIQDEVESLQKNYIEAQMQSQGALVRLAMNAIPAVLILIKFKNFFVSLPHERLWFWFALASLLTFGLYFFTSSSTALDRISLYLLPLQLMVFSFLPEVVGGKSSQNRQMLIFIVIFFYGVVQFVWLNFAIHSSAWLPFSLILFNFL